MAHEQTINFLNIYGPTLLSTAITLAISLTVFSWKISGRFTVLETKFDSLSSEVKDIRGDIKDIRGEIKEVHSRIDGVRDELHDLKNKVTGMEVQVNMLIIHPEILAKGAGRLQNPDPH